MSYVIVFLMMVNGAPTWVEMPSKTVETGQKEVFYTHRSCLDAAIGRISALKPINVLDFGCNKVEK